MIKVKIGQDHFNVRTSWKEITYSDFCKIISFNSENNIHEFVSLVSGVPCNTLKNIDVQSFDTIKTLISFVEDYSFFEKYNFIPDELKSFDIGEHSWYKMEKAKIEIKKHKSIYCAMGEIIKIYLGEVIESKYIPDVWGKINFLIKQLNDFFDKYKRLSEYEEDEDEMIARVNRFEKFGFFCSCVELSRKMGKTYDEVLKMSATEIYQTFLYDFEKSDYEKTLYRIKSKKQ